MPACGECGTHKYRRAPPRTPVAPTGILIGSVSRAEGNGSIFADPPIALKDTHRRDNNFILFLICRSCQYRTVLAARIFCQEYARSLGLRGAPRGLYRGGLTRSDKVWQAAKRRLLLGRVRGNRDPSERRAWPGTMWWKTPVTTQTATSVLSTDSRADGVGENGPSGPVYRRLFPTGWRVHDENRMEVSGRTTGGLERSVPGGAEPSSVAQRDDASAVDLEGGVPSTRSATSWLRRVFFFASTCRISLMP